MGNPKESDAQEAGGQDCHEQELVLVGRGPAPSRCCAPTLPQAAVCPDLISRCCDCMFVYIDPRRSKISQESWEHGRESVVAWHVEGKGKQQ
jgi:hypothetical protein